MISFPRLSARTLRFSLGQPRSFSISSDGQRILFIRSSSGEDRRGLLWQLDLNSGIEKLLTPPSENEENLSVEERARRERLREGSAGITSFSTDGLQRKVAFTQSGKAQILDVETGAIQEIDFNSAVVDPRLSPDGKYLAAPTVDGSFSLADVETLRTLGTLHIAEQSLGLAEFVASEEMNRFRGYWWSPKSDQLLVQATDESEIQTWFISDPAHPELAPRAVKYPQVGTSNAKVRLHLVNLQTQSLGVIEIPSGYEYLVDIHWSSYGPPLLYVMNREQTKASTFALDLASLSLSEIASQTDERWLEVFPGTPAWTPAGELLLMHDGEYRTLTLNGRSISPQSWNVRSVLDIDSHGITFTASSEPTEEQIWWYGFGGELEQLTTDPGVHSGRTHNHTFVHVSRSLSYFGPKVEVERDGEKFHIKSVALEPNVSVNVKMLELGELKLRSALLLPSTGNQKNLPLLVDPYGGPHWQRVLASRSAYAEAQWIADQGFAVLISDGRGTPARGPEWEKSIHHDLASFPVEDQVSAVEALIATHPGLIDRERIAIRGWSFGGYLAALAVLDRPDIFAAAIAGAPVADFRLYDTFYTERYLGHRGTEPGYENGSLFTRANKLSRPLMIIHGLADDNVVVANSLQLSSLLLANGKPHETLLLSNVTHMTPQEEVAENLLLLQIEFLKRRLDL